MPEIRVLIADDHAMLRSGLNLLLRGQEDITVVGEAADGIQAVNLSADLQPDVILLDLTMPGLGGLDAIPLLRKASPESRILVLTMHEDDLYLRQVLKTGAAGYIIKKAADVELISAVRAVARGELYIHPSLTRGLLEGMIPADDIRSQSDTNEEWETLSEREREVLRLVALGHTSAAIGEQLSLSVKTVETYRARGMEKLGLRSRAALVKYALARGLLDD
ncbi:MAG: response regulator transcription factor [Anaerolineae bacterium]